eukprot:tig00001424_g8705.t1
MSRPAPAAPAVPEGAKADADGFITLPATRRPDGTWRKERRVRAGYVPPDEQPVFESRGKVWREAQSDLPPGYVPDEKPKPKPKAEKKEKGKEEKSPASGSAPSGAKSSAPPASSKPQAPATEESEQDPNKKAKNLQKKLRQIEELETKDPSTLNDDQRDKIKQKRSIEEEIKLLLEKLSV